VLGVTLAGIEFGHRQYFRHFRLDRVELAHAGDRIEAQITAAAEHADIVIERVFLAVAEGEILGPVELVRRRVVARWLGPADQVDRGIAVLFALGIRLVRRFLHVVERRVARRGEYVNRSTLTVADYLAEWLVAHATTVKPKTFAGYRYDIEHYIVPRIG